ncbi:DinB family protein [Kitasatospora cystarginea]|uniref:DinB family protein n=1 Tax=Kitasatospora cystarginea TaxID=58350 RepID=A0ABN3DFN1_9ACTN
MTTLDWATVLDRLFDAPDDPATRSWAEEALAAGSGTPGQRRAYDLLVAGHDVIDLLAETPAAVAGLLAAADPGRITVAPAENEWSALHIVHHVADNEAVNAVRIRSILTEDTPTVFGYDSHPWTRFFALETWQDALERFSTARRNTVALARSLDAEDLDRRGVLSYRGAESLRVLLAVLAGHDRDHLDQLRSALAAAE